MTHLIKTCTIYGMTEWTIEEITLPLKFTWKISRSSCDVKTNFIVTVKNGENFGQGEVAFNTRFDESREQIINSFETFKNSSFPSKIGTIEELIKFVDDIGLPNSLRFGIESAFVSYLSSLSDISIHELLGRRQINSVNTSFSLPIIPENEIEQFIVTHNLRRFSTLKIKVTPDNMVENIKRLMNLFPGNIRVDANESFKDPDQVIKAIEELGPNAPIEFLEQPLPADFHDESLYLFENSEVDIFADESVVKQEIGQYYLDRFHGVNIKLMKSGGYLKAIKQLQEAKKIGLRTMLGCMVETSLGISCAMNIAHGVDFFDLDGYLFLEKDPFNKVSEENGRLFFSHLQ